MASIKIPPHFRRALALLLAGFLPADLAVGEGSEGAAPTYTKDVAPIMIKHCVSCHRPGEAAPMSLTSYEETRPWAKAIKDSVLSRDMPPWDADPTHGKFANDISLSTDQVQTISSWVDQGAPMGDPKDMPAMPKFKSGFKLGEPDYVIELPEVSVPADGGDLFPELKVPTQISERRWIRAMEVLPGDPGVLHHFMLFTGGSLSSLGTVQALTVWAAGTGPVTYPGGCGRWIERDQVLTASMHYHPNGKPAKDRTRIALYFGKGELLKEVTSTIAGTLGFTIPPQASDHRLVAHLYLTQDIDIISYFPHMHMRGKQMSFTARYPDGTEEVLINVPKYDFNWQWCYYPIEPKRLPANTDIRIDASFDNSAANPSNPDPSKSVTFGSQSTDEMMFGFFEFIPVEGVRPKPITADREFAEIAARHPANEIFEVGASLGEMNTKSLFHIPRTGGRGTLYLPLGGPLVWPIELAEIKWKGNEFTCLFAMPGTQPSPMKGALDPQGRLLGFGPAN